ncbi:MAG: hypothetical protein WA950_12450 [Shinella sp.]|uniref:hypothetical protein n=1 Tax=Shinella sp. TaxID=1870904 RepID=UPI003C7322A8
MIRSLIYAGLALAAMALTISAPAVAATPTDPGIYQSVKASLDAPAILQVYDEHVALTCEAPAVMTRSDGRSLGAADSLILANTSSSPIRFVELRRRC